MNANGLSDWKSLHTHSRRRVAHGSWTGRKCTGTLISLNVNGLSDRKSLHMHGRCRVAHALHWGKVHWSLNIIRHFTCIHRHIRITHKWNLSVTHVAFIFVTYGITCIALLVSHYKHFIMHVALRMSHCVCRITRVALHVSHYMHFIARVTLCVSHYARRIMHDA